MRGSLGLQDVRLHDFRRTLSTHLYRATKDDYLVKRCINHTNKNITAIYVRISEEEVAKALQAQADRFWALPVAVVPPAVVERSYTSIDQPLEEWEEPAHDLDSIAQPPVTTDLVPSLSRREQEVLIGFAQGHSLKTIAQVQGLSIKTVDTYRARLRDKLQLRTTNDLIRYAILHENDVTMPLPTHPTPMPIVHPPRVMEQEWPG